MSSAVPAASGSAASSRRPDICLLIPSLVGGGAERVCVLLANHWAAQGQVVWLIALRGEGSFLELLDSRISLFAFNRQRARDGVTDLLRFLRRTPDLPILIFGFELGIVAAFLKFLGLIRNPLIYREGNNPWFQISARRRWLYGALISWMDGCIAQGRYLAGQLRQLGVAGTPIMTIPNPMVSRLPTVPWRPAPRVPVIVTAGRLVGQKRIDRLIAGFAAWRERGTESRLLIAGEGPEEVRLREQVQALGLQAQISLLGFEQNIQAVYERADLFVLPSGFEGQPNALLEALSAGCRILAAGGEPVRELLGQLGLAECWLADEDFGAALGDKIRMALALPESRWAQARVRLQTLTEINAVAGRYLALCRAAQNGGPGAGGPV